VALRDVWHRYEGRGDWTLAGIDLSLRPGELVGLLGPSGCGKTTLLRLIAGFERPRHGAVDLDGREVSGPARWLPPERRGVGMVFQDYALFPHLNAWRNACFGLSAGHDPARVPWLMELLGLDGLEGRFPHELSGGQRQRLALVRALAPGPAVLLLDEPFSNLDVEVRLRLRSELPGVLQECGASGLMVTHDPGEALAICDRVAVLRRGHLHQCAPPRLLVDDPATAFVGRFVLQANLLPVERRGALLRTPLGPMRLAAAGPDAPDVAPRIGQEPEEVLIGQDDLLFVDDGGGEARVLGREFLGQQWLYRVQLGPLQLRLRLPLEQNHPRGSRGRLLLRDGARGRLYPSREPVLA
jgi:iron(III) transport system ATP-binding protein